MHFLLTLAVLISCYDFKQRNRILHGNQISNKILTLPLVYDNKFSKSRVRFRFRQTQECCNGKCASTVKPKRINTSHVTWEWYVEARDFHQSAEAEPFTVGKNIGIWNDQAPCTTMKLCMWPGARRFLYMDLTLFLLLFLLVVSASLST